MGMGNAVCSGRELRFQQGGCRRFPSGTSRADIQPDAMVSDLLGHDDGEQTQVCLGIWKTDLQIDAARCDLAISDNVSMHATG